MMTRAEHVRWCKERAREYLRSGDIEEAVTSMLSDLSKHPETEGVEKKMAMFGILIATKSQREAERFVEGFAE